MSWTQATHGLVVAAIGSLVVFFGGRVVTAVFALVERRTPHQANEADPEPQPRIRAAAQTLRGGSWIGALERLAVFATLLAHFPAGIAIAVSLKGLARYPELAAPNSGAAERFIIGTFVSVLLACGAAGLAHWVTGLW